MHLRCWAARQGRASSRKPPAKAEARESDGRGELLPRNCPTCGSDDIIGAGRVTLERGRMRVAERCRACGAAFDRTRMVD